jgi:hypothetical protein
MGCRLSWVNNAPGGLGPSKPFSAHSLNRKGSITAGSRSGMQAGKHAAGKLSAGLFNGRGGV